MSAKKQSPGDTPGYVYLMRRGEFYKIGHAHNPAARARQVHETSAPAGTYGHPSVLLWSLRCKDQITAERALHMRFVEYHAGRGEWFALPDEAIAWICEQDEDGICTGYDASNYWRVDLPFGEDSVKRTYNLNVELLKKLESEAKRNRRTNTTQLEIILEEWFETHPPADAHATPVDTKEPALREGE